MMAYLTECKSADPCYVEEQGVLKIISSSISSNLASDIDGPVNVSSRKGNKTRLFWSPPNENELKMNVDAAFCTESGEATAGIAVRNHQGSVVAAASIVLKKCKDVEEAEATAIWEGLKFATQHNLKPLDLESDSAMAVAAVNSLVPFVSANWHVYRNINRLRVMLPDCTISKIGRKGNGVAHDLAGLAKRSGVSNFWLMPIPDFINDFCNQDSVRDPVLNV
jgi:hypothetical protein